MKVLKSGETLVTYEGDVTAGALKVNDAFDLYLAKLKDGNYILVVFMKLQFFFKDGEKLKWTKTEKTNFISNWKLAIKQKWGGRVIKKLNKGKKVDLDFRFEIQVGGFMLDHWEITVTKVNAFTVSSVNTGMGNVTLDSRDLMMTAKSGGFSQRGAVHEFGHMLGIDDEYKKGTTYATDYKSVMNSGEFVLSRHNNPFIKWLEEKLKANNIK